MSVNIGHRYGSSASKASDDYGDDARPQSNMNDADDRSSTSSSDYNGFLDQGHRGPSQQANKSDSDYVGIDGDSRRDNRSRDHLIETNTQAGTALPQVNDTENADAAKGNPISWRSLPRKDQLFVLTLARLSEPLTQTSLGSYLFYQLQSFDPSLPESTIAYQAGVIQAAFPFAQFLTAMLWGRFADSPYGGRKLAINIGLFGTMCSIIGFGFSHSFGVAVAFRLFGGALNGNIGIMRTMISEIIKEKKFQSRAFLLLPMTFNVGVIVGPILGGLLADPVASYPSIFGPESWMGGKDGVYWMRKWPYALPNLTCAVFLLFSSLAVLFFLEETSEFCKDNPDRGLRFGRWIKQHLFHRNMATSTGYTAVADDEEAASSFELQPTPTSANRPSTPMASESKHPPRQILPFRRIWTRSLITTLFAHGLLAMHVGGFNSLWFIYLSTPRYDPADPYPKGFKPHGFVHFTGGLALPPPRIGLALSILGVIGISLQLFVYPSLSHRLGAAKSYRIFLALFPLTYTLAPFLSRVWSSTAPPAGVTGPAIWICITVVLFIQVLARTFALPCTAILINNVSPHPSVLGTVHGIGQSVSSLTRTFGPIIFSWAFGKGLDMGIVGLSWWIMATVAIMGWVVAQGVREGDGHEILMEGEVRGPDGTVKRVD